MKQINYKGEKLIYPPLYIIETHFRSKPDCILGNGGNGFPITFYGITKKQLEKELLRASRQY